MKGRACTALIRRFSWMPRLMTCFGMRVRCIVVPLIIVFVPATLFACSCRVSVNRAKFSLMHHCLLSSVMSASIVSRCLSRFINSLSHSFCTFSVNLFCSSLLSVIFLTFIISSSTQTSCSWVCNASLHVHTCHIWDTLGMHFDTSHMVPLCTHLTFNPVPVFLTVMSN